MSRLIFTLAVLAAAWSIASAGYYWTMPWLGASVGYNDAPLFYAAYYALWAALVFLLFRPAFLEWSGGGARADTILPAGALVVLFAAYALLVLPHLPETEWTRENSPVEFFYANSWYFLPKSVEILFQQILIAALILALDHLRLPLWKISLVVATLFGGFHLTLALSMPNPFYVARYTVAATLFGLLAPWLILRLRYGFLLSYAIHWSYYAIDIALIHYAFAKPS